MLRGKGDIVISRCTLAVLSRQTRRACSDLLICSDRCPATRGRSRRHLLITTRVRCAGYRDCKPGARLPAAVDPHDWTSIGRPSACSLASGRASTRWTIGRADAADAVSIREAVCHAHPVTIARSGLGCDPRADQRADRVPRVPRDAIPEPRAAWPEVPGFARSPPAWRASRRRARGSALRRAARGPGSRLAPTTASRSRPSRWPRRRP